MFGVDWSRIWGKGRERSKKILTRKEKKVWIFTHNDFKGYTLRHPFTSSGLGTSLRALKHKVSKQYTHNLKKVPYIFFFFFPEISYEHDS